MVSVLVCAGGFRPNGGKRGSVRHGRGLCPGWGSRSYFRYRRH